MSEDSDFFGDVFDTPEDDPLLGGSPESAGTSSEKDGPSTESGPPSWVTDEPTTNGTTSPMNGTESNGINDASPTRKQIVVDQQDDDDSGIEALNQAVGQGWRLVHIYVRGPGEQQTAPTQPVHRVVAVLEQDRPQSLFDFGAAA